MNFAIHFWIVVVLFLETSNVSIQFWIHDATGAVISHGIWRAFLLDTTQKTSQSRWRRKHHNQTGKIDSEYGDEEKKWLEKKFLLYIIIVRNETPQAMS